MKKNYILPKIFLTVLMLLISCSQSNQFSEIKGSYLGQEPPGIKAKVFAPGIICGDMYERDVAMTPDGKEMYFGVIVGNNTYSAIVITKQIDGRWTKPEIAPFSSNPETRNLEPHITPDGKKFLFVSNRSAEGTENGEDNWDIWAMDWVGDGWSEPYNLGAPINTEVGEFFPSVTREGTLYFTREEPNRLNGIYRSRLVAGKYTEPERLPSQVNCGRSRYNAFIAPDESYIIVPAFAGPGSFGGTDYYIVFRNQNDQWSQPLNMGEEINSASGFEWSAYVSPDSKYLFFMSVREEKRESFESVPLTLERMQQRQRSFNNGNPNIYWMSASVLDSLKQHAVFE